MKYSDPRKLSLNVSFFVVIFTGIIYTAISLTFFNFNFYILLILLLSLYVFIYFLFRFTLERFIYGKIKVIYKTIHNLKTPRDKKRNIEIKADTIESVNKEVQEWGEVQKKEIEQLKQMAKYRREFMGNISHELKTPIFNIQGYVLTLLDGGLEDPSINKRYLLKTEKSINRMIAIVEDLEEISHLESGELELHMTKFDIAGLFKDIFDFLEIKARKKDNTLHFGGSYDKPVWVTADKKKIRQVLINLVDNAIKYGKEKKGYTEVSFFDMDENILVEVTDNGEGIPKESVSRIFERFYRTDKGRSREMGGTGLGLAIVKHIIEAHNQTISVRSSLGVGTTFAFTLKKGK